MPYAGYGSQALAFKYLGVPFESYKIAEFAVKSIQAYKDMHFTDDNTDYSESLTKDEIINYLYTKGISADYNQPMAFEQIKRLAEPKQRQIYNNIKATHNLVSVCKVKGEDLEITDTDKYCYIVTYSFPCQDLSNAGKGLGMGRDCGTRSGLLWEVERLLKELHEDNKPLPQVLLMENVPEVIGKKNIKHFAEWVKTLDELGYKSKWQLLNAKDYEIPQNRNRCFMVSILGDYYYDFPQPKPLKLRLKDMLEDNVDEKYYLSNKTIEMFVKHTEKKQAEGCGFKFEPTDGTRCAKCISTRAGSRTDDNFIKCEQVAQIKGAYESSNRVYSVDGLCSTINTCGGGNLEPKIIQRPHGYNQGAELEDCPSITVSSWQENNLLKEPIKIMEVNNKTICLNSKVDGKQPSLTNRVYDSNGCSTAITTSSFFMGSILEEPTERFYQQALKTAQENDCDNGDIIDAYNGKVNKDGVSPTVTTRPEGFKTAILPIQDYRIRKLTPKECFRLMGVKDEDYKRVAKNQSNSSLYHLAGDSLVTILFAALIAQMVDNGKEKYNKCVHDFYLQISK